MQSGEFCLASYLLFCFYGTFPVRWAVGLIKTKTKLSTSRSWNCAGTELCNNLYCCIWLPHYLSSFCCLFPVTGLIQYEYVWPLPKSLRDSTYQVRDLTGADILTKTLSIPHEQSCKSTTCSKILGGAELNFHFLQLKICWKIAHCIP